MLTNDINEINAIFDESIIDPSTLSAAAPLARFAGAGFLVPGTITLVTAPDYSSASQFITHIAASTSSSNAGSLESLKTAPSMLLIDAESTRTSLASWRDSVSALCNGRFPASVTISSARGYDHTRVIDTVENAAARGRYDIIVVNDVSSIVKSESYAETQKMLRRLSLVADNNGVHIVLIASSGFKISIKRPSRVASLYLKYCSSIVTLARDAEDSTLEATLIDVNTLAAFTAPLAAVTAPLAAAHSEPLTPSEPTEPSTALTPVEPSVSVEKIPLKKLSKSEARKARRLLRREKKRAALGTKKRSNAFKSIAS